MPKAIRDQKPAGSGNQKTMVKKINGKYYVYRYTNEKTKDGKTRHKNGAYLGVITLKDGFIGRADAHRKGDKK